MMVQRYTCVECGGFLDLLNRDVEPGCGDCGETMEWDGTVGVVGSINEDND